MRRVLKFLIYSVLGLFLVFLFVVVVKSAFVLLLSKNDSADVEIPVEVEVNLAEVSQNSVSECVFPLAGEARVSKEYVCLPFAGAARTDHSSPEIFMDKNILKFFGSEISLIDFGFVKERENAALADKGVKEKKEKTSDSVFVETLETAQPSVYLADAGSNIELTDDFISLCAMVHYEAGEGASVESKAYVGNVAMNRLRNPAKWGYSSLHDVLYADGQFTVVRMAKFNSMKEKLRSLQWNDYMKSSVMAAHLAYTGSSLYDIPDDVQYFYGDPNKTTWGKHVYCFSFGGNSFFK